MKLCVPSVEALKRSVLKSLKADVWRGLAVQTVVALYWGSPPDCWGLKSSTVVGLSGYNGRMQFSVLSLCLCIKADPVLSNSYSASFCGKRLKGGTCFTKLYSVGKTGLGFYDVSSPLVFPWNQPNGAFSVALLDCRLSKTELGDVGGTDDNVCHNSKPPVQWGWDRSQKCYQSLFTVWVNWGLKGGEELSKNVVGKLGTYLQTPTSALLEQWDLIRAKTWLSQQSVCSVMHWRYLPCNGQWGLWLLKGEQILVPSVKSNKCCLCFTCSVLSCGVPEEFGSQRGGSVSSRDGGSENSACDLHSEWDEGHAAAWLQQTFPGNGT